MAQRIPNTLLGLRPAALADPVAATFAITRDLVALHREHRVIFDTVIENLQDADLIPRGRAFLE